jgi:ubiquinone/menaquinone biosynthesis C-methylase UbiE
MLSGAAALVGGVVLWFVAPLWSIPLFAWTALMFAGAAVYVHASLRGKYAIWADLLDKASLADGERALDLGCGRGAVAICVARRFPGADVTGIDLWRSVDQSGNSPDTARRNAELNGVGDRVHFDTGDMLELPYPDQTFALVTASVAIHNISTDEARRRAIRQAVRVTAPGGKIIIADIYRRRVEAYAEELRQAGCAVDGPTPAGWNGWFTGPWLATRTIVAAKPR